MKISPGIVAGFAAGLLGAFIVAASISGSPPPFTLDPNPTFIKVDAGQVNASGIDVSPGAIVCANLDAGHLNSSGIDVSPGAIVCSNLDAGHLNSAGVNVVGALLATNVDAGHLNSNGIDVSPGAIVCANLDAGAANIASANIVTTNIGGFDAGNARITGTIVAPDFTLSAGGSCCRVSQFTLGTTSSSLVAVAAAQDISASVVTNAATITAVRATVQVSGVGAADSDAFEFFSAAGGAGTNFATCTVSCTAAVGTVVTCTVNSAAVSASTTVFGRITDVSCTTDPVVSLSMTLTTP